MCEIAPEPCEDAMQSISELEVLEARLWAAMARLAKERDTAFNSHVIRLGANTPEHIAKAKASLETHDEFEDWAYAESRWRLVRDALTNAKSMLVAQKEYQRNEDPKDRENSWPVLDDEK